MAEPKEYVIFRYKNRKMYSQLLAKYVTLTDIKNMILLGCKVKVISRPGEPKDLTREILIDIYARLLKEPTGPNINYLADIIREEAKHGSDELA